MAESKDELKLLMKVKEECKKASLKFNMRKMKIMASGPIPSWQIDGEIMKTVTNYSLGSKITADGEMVAAAMKLNDACSLEEKS